MTYFLSRDQIFLIFKLKHLNQCTTSEHTSEVLQRAVFMDKGRKAFRTYIFAYLQNIKGKGSFLEVFPLSSAVHQDVKKEHPYCEKSHPPKISQERYRK